MGKLRILAVFILVGIFETLAIPRQQRSRNSAPWNCGRISFMQKGQNTHLYTNEEVNKKCYNLQSAHQTALMLNTHAHNCPYKVVAFSMNDCDDESDDTEYQMKPVVHLNKLPVCSFYIETLPPDGSLIAVKFREASSTKTHYVYRADCYNICNGPSNFEYPDIVQLFHADENFARGYSVQLFSTPGCHSEDEITNQNDERIMKRNGAMDLTSITLQPKTLSYAILSDNS